MKASQAYRFALDPTPEQERALRSHAGASRFAWNWGLAKCKERYDAEGKWYSAAELHKLWNADKKADPALAWWSENSKCACQESFRDLDRALRDFTKSGKGQRKGRRPGFPKFKKRGKCRDSFRFSTGAIRCGWASVTLPRLGEIRTHESARKLARRVENGTARILSATVSRTAQRWFVSFTVEVERDVPERHARPGSAIGVDLGVKTLLTGVDDAGNLIAVEGPKPLRTQLRKLQRASRACSRKQPGSANRRKCAGRLARIHARVANVRADALHKATTDLARRYETVVAEDLNVTGMISNRRLARAVSDQGFGTAMELRHLEHFVAIAQEGSFTLAARRVLADVEVARRLMTRGQRDRGSRCPDGGPAMRYLPEWCNYLSEYRESDGEHGAHSPPDLRPQPPVLVKIWIAIDIDGTAFSQEHADLCERRVVIAHPARKAQRWSTSST